MVSTGSNSISDTFHYLEGFCSFCSAPLSQEQEKDAVFFTPKISVYVYRRSYGNQEELRFTISTDDANVKNKLINDVLQFTHLPQSNRILNMVFF